ncbi:hypothetical protein F0562_025434 [Nyssa sinensis]|uniref:Uncharacterized protein n=1 Tax=Nyssa sinensis TaxID=561372 RepID=A0A5J5BJX8_9ASTE|nr:hypothetical protein F0562_025434 [Nyssa sinensis]
MVMAMAMGIVQQQVVPVSATAGRSRFCSSKYSDGVAVSAAAGIVMVLPFLQRQLIHMDLIGPTVNTRCHTFERPYLRPGSCQTPYEL